MENEFNELSYNKSVEESLNLNGNFVGDVSQNEFESSSQIKSEFNTEEGSYSASKKTTSTLSFTAFMTMIASVVFAVVAIVVLSSGASNHLATFNSLNVYGNSFDYDISVELDYLLEEGTVVDFSSVDSSLRLVVANSSTSFLVELQADENNSAQTPVIVQTIEDGNYHVTYSFVGTVASLQSGTNYQVEVIDVSQEQVQTLASQTIKTLDGAVSQINGVTYKCNCTTDGTFEFQLDFVDENNFYSYFTYSILTLDNEKTVFENIAIENPFEKQIISNITQINGGEYTLQISYLSSAFSDTGDPSGQEMVEKIIEIEIKV